MSRKQKEGREERPRPDNDQEEIERMLDDAIERLQQSQPQQSFSPRYGKKK